MRPYMAKSDGMTCNGNGDGVINGGYEVEASLFWQHLSLAGLIPGAYTGTCGYTGANCGTNGFYEAVNVDMPPGPFGITGIVLINPDLILTPNSSPGSYWPQGGQHVFWLEGTYSADGSGNAVWNDYGMNLWAMTSAQALAIDTKYDDGNPGTGAITNGGPLTGNGSTSGKEVCMDGTLSPPQYWSAVHWPSGGTVGGWQPACDLMFKAGF